MIKIAGHHVKQPAATMGEKIIYYVRSDKLTG